MPKVRVPVQSVSLDGFSAGPHQSLEDPLGAGGEQLHEWFLATEYGRAMMGEPADGHGLTLDDEIAATSQEGFGATIMGRNMFGPVRSNWPDESWTGWWGENPPYHHPVFVLTHHPRKPLEMAGGTTFDFVTDGPEAALRRARQAAGDRDVQISGGAETIRQYLRAGLIEELHLHIAPIFLGRGERLLDGVGEPKMTPVALAGSPNVTHITYRVERG
jgi:dihydrofolate reductase